MKSTRGAWSALLAVAAPAQGTNCRTFWRHRPARSTGRACQATSGRVGRGFEDDGVAGRQGGRDTAAGDGDGKIPGRDDHADAFAAACGLVAVLQKASADVRIVLGKIDGF